MSSTPAHDLLPDELAALMHFYAEAGVTWLSEDGPVDRFAEPVPQPRARAPEASGQSAGGTGSSGGAQRPGRAAAPPPVMQAPAVFVPDAEVIEAARSVAASAADPAALIAAVEGFTACNLKSSARHTVFAEGNAAARVVVVSGMPSADDDREGKPFSGPAGLMLNRMLAGIGVDTDAVMTVNIIPWRTPGDRAPTVREVEICRPFAQRLVELMQPQAVLVLGNLPARILSNESKAGIHALRGRWFDFDSASSAIPALATFHPLEMLTMPTAKRVAWQDMLLFGSKVASDNGSGPPNL